MTPLLRVICLQLLCWCVVARQPLTPKQGNKHPERASRVQVYLSSILNGCCCYLPIKLEICDIL